MIRINECVPNEEEMAKHSKKLLGTVQPKLGTLGILEKSNGSNKEVGEDTFNEMMSAHYPDDLKAKKNTYDQDYFTTLTVLASKYN